MDHLTSTVPPRASDGIGAPLREPVFRRIWLASLLSNFGMLVQGVGAAWAMTLMTSSADKVALVQTAAMLPTMLISIAAGAIADMYDRRVVALVGLCIALAGATTLSILTFLGAITPNILLLFCFIVGTGMALFGPSWQASVSEQVSPETLPAAVALNGISYNIARSFGPAIGGIIVAAAGAGAAFVTNAALYLPLLIVLYLWRRQHEPSRLPPEGLRRAMVSGVRYIVNSPQTRVVLTRTLVTGMLGGSAFALMPLVARDLLHGNAQTYGLMLGAFGVGAVIGALNIARIRRKIDDERFVRIGAMIMGLGIVTAGLSHSIPLTVAALVMTGAMWTMSVTVYNIGVQLSAPRWVAGRALASFQTAIAGGIAAGSWGWGHTADIVGVDHALMIGGGLLFLSPLLGIRLRMPTVLDVVRGRRDPCRPASPPAAQSAQRAHHRRDRVPRRRESRPRILWRDAGGAARPPAHRRLRLVDRPRHHRARAVDRALPLPDLARLSAPAQSPDGGGAPADAERAGISHRRGAGADQAHAGAAVRLGALEGRYAGSRAGRRAADLGAEQRRVRRSKACGLL